MCRTTLQRRPEWYLLEIFFSAQSAYDNFKKLVNNCVVIVS